MQTPGEAVARILAEISALPVERVPLADSLGRVLATAAVSPVTLPHWNNSAMDGYAVRGGDIVGSSKQNPVMLRVSETVAAGEFATGSVGEGVAVRIMTGAPVPDGADTVVRVEDTDGGVDFVNVFDDRDAGRNVRPRGEDLQSGSVVLEAGTVIGAAQIGVLASIGYSRLSVFRRPRVAIAGSGDELVDLDNFGEVLAGRRIVSSNSYTIAALVRECGGVPIDLGIATDSLDSVVGKFEAARGCDLVITSAGVSVGEHDYTRIALQKLGADLKFWKVRMRPGAPIGFGMLAGVPWLGLPGNPVSAMVTFELFARPTILRMAGHSRLFRRIAQVEMQDTFRSNARLTHFLRGVVSSGADGKLAARLTGPQGSGILTSMSRANALLVLPETQEEVLPGQSLNAMMLREESYLSEHFAID